MKYRTSSAFGLALAITITFGITARAQTYTLSAYASTGGSVSKSPDQASYAPGTQVTITAITNAGCLFAYWYGDNGDINSTNNPLVVTMTSNITVTALFSLIAPIQNYTNRFDTLADTASWTAWGGSPTPVVAWDATTDAGGNPASGSLRITEGFTGTAGEQFMVFGTLANRWAWDNGLTLDCRQYTNLTFDLKVAPGTSPTRNNDYGPLDVELVDIVDWNSFILGTYEVPLSATNWTHVVLPIDPALPGLSGVTGIGFHMGSGGLFTNTLTFWVDNVTLQVSTTASPAISLSPTLLANPVFGVPYSQTLMATGGSPPYVFSLTSGSLPAGLSLTPGPQLVNTLAGMPGFGGTVDGTNNSARFTFPAGVAVDSAGNLYVADSHNDMIRKVTPAGVVTTLAGLARTYGTNDGTGTSARFNYPEGVAVDSAGNLYVADLEPHDSEGGSVGGLAEWYTFRSRNLQLRHNRYRHQRSVRQPGLYADHTLRANHARPCRLARPHRWGRLQPDPHGHGRPGDLQVRRHVRELACRDESLAGRRVQRRAFRQRHQPLRGNGY
jgi:hypothetical protein